MTEAPSDTITRNWARPPATTPARTTPTPTTVPYDLALDWRHCRISRHPRPCRLCRRGALMLDPDGLPCHKTCQEQHLLRTLGLAGARRAVAASHRPRTRAREGS